MVVRDRDGAASVEEIRTDAQGGSEHVGTNNRARRAANKAKRDRKRRTSAHQRNAPSSAGLGLGPHGPGCTCPWPDGGRGADGADSVRNDDAGWCDPTWDGDLFDDMAWDDEFGARETETIESLFAKSVLAARRKDGSVVVLLESLDIDFVKRDVDVAIERRLTGALRTAWESGWQPLDIVEYMRRQAEESEVILVTDAIASETAQYAPATIDGRWSEQIDSIGAERWWPDERPLLDAWTERYATEAVIVWHIAAIVMGILEALVSLNVTLPLPGSAAARAAARTGDVDEKVLARVRALLAKAESTEYPDEAEALSAKAQQLMTKFSLDRVLVEETAGERIDDGVAERRIWLDKPYVSAKAMLVTVVAGVNRCRSILFDKIGFASVVGDPTDVRLVEVLTTSLLVQANRAMLAQGSRRTVRGQSRTRSYRQSFLVSYAQRIGERLEEGVTAAHQEVGADDRLLPALAARDARVEEKVAELYPNLRRTRVSASNQAGWEDGRVAADMANLDVHRSVKSS